MSRYGFRGWLYDYRGLVVISIITILLVGGATCAGCLISDLGGADGQHVGMVTSVERLKNFTWDATVAHIKSDLESTQEEAYCVETPEIERKLIDAAKRKQRVVVHFRNDLFMMRWECNGGESVVWKVEDVPVEEGL